MAGGYEVGVLIDGRYVWGTNASEYLTDGLTSTVASNKMNVMINFVSSRMREETKIRCKRSTGSWVKPVPQRDPYTFSF